jgi:hypothetical protein
MSASREAGAIVKKQLAQRELLWPRIEAWLWNRKANKGFATIPKTMPLILQIMDDMSSGKPLSSTYLGLWCETWDNSMVNIAKPLEMAHAAGFMRERAVYTWSGRMKILKSLNFIDIQPGRAGDISHVLIYNPHYVIRWHHEHKTPGLLPGNFNALLARALEIGAKDMLDGPPTVAPSPAPSPAPTPTVPTEFPPLPAEGIASAPI